MTGVRPLGHAIKENTEIVDAMRWIHLLHLMLRSYHITWPCHKPKAKRPSDYRLEPLQLKDKMCLTSGYFIVMTTESRLNSNRVSNQVLSWKWRLFYSQEPGLKVQFFPPGSRDGYVLRAGAALEICQKGRIHTLTSYIVGLFFIIYFNYILCALV